MTITRRTLTLIITLLIAFAHIHAQEWMRIHHAYDGQSWSVPLHIDQMLESQFDDHRTELDVRLLMADSTISVPFDVENLDSITFAESLGDADKGHNKYRMFTMNITTQNLAPIWFKEQWIDCHISIDGRGEYSNYSGMGRIRGRGNSTWEWYDKKPYKFKLDTKSKLLGLESARNWNLLANYRDVTDMMNVLAFEMARYMGLPHTNHTRFVEVFLNGDYIGVYQLTEKIEIGDHRVNIPKDGGLLMSFDKDDGPELSPFATDNFWSEVYRLPMCVKQPEDLTREQMDSIRSDFAVLERAIKAHDYALVDSLLDIPSFISMLQLHEMLFNVEIDAPRSLYIHKAPGGKYTFGPAWDWDAAFDFDWSDMMTGHTYFTSYKELIYGTDPLQAKGASYNINKFFRDMFGSATFVAQYKEMWHAVTDSIILRPWAEVERYAAEMSLGAYRRDTDMWPLDTYDWWGNYKSFKPSTELTKMATWLDNRKRYIDKIIDNYPAGKDEPVESDDPKVVVGATGITVTVPCRYSDGYQQSSRIAIPEDAVTSLLGGAPTSLVPLNANGTKGNNTAAGAYGAWFDTNGDTNPWSIGHVYIESNELYSWAYGCHPDNCDASHGTHTATMQYRRASKSLNVTVTFQMR